MKIKQIDPVAMAIKVLEERLEVLKYKVENVGSSVTSISSDKLGGIIFILIGRESGTIQIMVAKPAYNNVVSNCIELGEEINIADPQSIDKILRKIASLEHV